MKDSIILTREYIEQIEQLVAEQQAEELKRRLDEMHPADIAEMCDDMSIEDARYIYHLLEGEDAYRNRSNLVVSACNVLSTLGEDVDQCAFRDALAIALYALDGSREYPRMAAKE